MILSIERDVAFKDLNHCLNEMFSLNREVEQKVDISVLINSSDKLTSLQLITERKRLAKTSKTWTIVNIKLQGRIPDSALRST